MSYIKICDHCKQNINRHDDVIQINYETKNKNMSKHYHIDCFNYKFSCDIRKIEEE